MNQTFKKSKRAVSPIIATVLLVAIAIASSFLVYKWSTSFIGEHINKFSEPMDTVCQRITFDASLSERTLGVYDTDMYELVVNNQGNDNIKEMQIKAFEGGNSVVKSIAPTEGERMIGKGKTVTILFNPKMFELSQINKIEVTPLLLGKGVTSGKIKLKGCTDQTKKINLD